jgi:hypothetical protein
MHPHHRPSIADGIVPPVPGLLAGGPNAGRQDGQHYIYLEPETSYLDNDQAYASNEIAINWNAPLVYLSGGMEALQYAADYSQHGQTVPSSQAVPPAAVLQPMLHPLTRDRSGLYASDFLIAGEFSEQIVLNNDGSFEYRHTVEAVTDTAFGNYRIVGDKLYLTFAHSAAARNPVDARVRIYTELPRMFYMHGKKLYRADERGRLVKKAPGVSGRREYPLFGSRKRKYYLRLTQV